jgi:hypothetical protein
LSSDPSDGLSNNTLEPLEADAKSNSASSNDKSSIDSSNSGNTPIVPKDAPDLDRSSDKDTLYNNTPTTIVEVSDEVIEDCASDSTKGKGEGIIPLPDPLLLDSLALEENSSKVEPPLVIVVVLEAPGSDRLSPSDTTASDPLVPAADSLASVGSSNTTTLSGLDTVLAIVRTRTIIPDLVGSSAYLDEGRTKPAFGLRVPKVYIVVKGILAATPVYLSRSRKAEISATYSDNSESASIL